MKEQLKVYWWGYGGSMLLANDLRPLIESLGMSLTTISEWDNADVKWTRDTWLNELKKADIVIIPLNYKTWPAKSNNRLTQAMSLGKPVICSPLDAYVAIWDKHPGSFLYATNEEEWRTTLSSLKDQKLREILSKRALEASKDFSIEALGTKWIETLKSLSFSVDIVIPTYNNAKGLPLCLESIRNCTPEPHTVYVVNNGPCATIQSYLDAQKDLIHIKTGRMTFAQAVNVGIRAGKGKYVMILNDDTIVSKGWLGGLLEACGEGIGAVGCLSNCDKGWLHNYAINIAGVDLIPGKNTFEQIEPIIPQIYDFQSPQNEIVERDWVAFYCTLIPREVLNKVGLLCEEYVNSGEDTDLCKRIRKMGYKIIQNFKSFVFHFGAVSRRQAELEDYDKYHQEDVYTQQTLRKNWNNKTVVIYSGPSWEKWDYLALETGIGGSEIWQIWLSRELSKLGYRVLSFCDCAEASMDGEVEYKPYTDFPKYADEHWIDYLVLSRTVDPLDLPVRAGKVFVQIHDVFMLSERTKLHMDKVTKYATLSDWHLNFASEYHGIPKDKFVLTNNGIDFGRFDGINVERHPYRFHWSSSWDRGLDNVLYLWPWIRERLPEAELHVFYGTYNWKMSCLRKNDQEGLKKIAELEEKVKQPGVFTYGRISQRELAVEISKASVCLYPTWFSETWGITFVECQKAGVPVICSNYAGLITTLGDSAILLGNGDPWWSYSKDGRESFLRESLSLLQDRGKWQEWSDRGKKNAEKYSWANCALRWKNIFDS